MLIFREDLEGIRGLTSGSLYRSLVEWAGIRPDTPFVVEAETGRELSYAHALAAVNNMRQMLGDTPRCVMLALPGGIASAVIWLSALSGGHLLVPVSPDATDEEKTRIAKKYKPDVLFVEHAQEAQSFAYPHAKTITKLQCDALIERASFCGTLHPSGGLGVTPPQGAINLAPIPPQGSVCLTTSGSTGIPKGVMLRESQIAWTADHVRASHELSSEDRGLTVLPFFHVNAPVVSLCSSLLAGGTAIIARRFSRRNFWSWIERYQVSWASIVPTIVAMLLETEKPAFLPGSLRFVRTGSAALPAADLQAFEARFSIPVIETYGLSEAASMVVANPVPPRIHKPGSAGRPVGVTLRICYPRIDTNDEHTEPLCDVEPGETGEICIAGPGVIDAYADDAGQEAFQDGWFRTGDLGYLDDDGYLFIRGRLREVINRGGENIAPREVEEVLLRHPAVREAAVVGRPDSIYGEQVVAYLAIRDTWIGDLAQELHQFAAQRLSPQKVPIDFMVLEALPRNATGKIDRHLLRLRERALARPNSDVGAIHQTVQAQ